LLYLTLPKKTIFFRKKYYLYLKPVSDLSPEPSRFERILLSDFPANLFMNWDLRHIHEDFIESRGVLGHHLAIPFAIDA
jgi:hypothetical protein